MYGTFIHVHLGQGACSQQVGNKNYFLGTVNHVKTCFVLNIALNCFCIKYCIKLFAKYYIGVNVVLNNCVESFYSKLNCDLK